MLQETIEAIESVVDETTGGMSDNVKLGLKVAAGAVALGLAYKGYKTMTRPKSTGRFTTSKTETKQEVPTQPEVKEEVDATPVEPHKPVVEANKAEVKETKVETPTEVIEDDSEEVDLMVVSLSSLSTSIRDRITELALQTTEEVEVETDEVVLAEETIDVDNVITDIVFVSRELKKNPSVEMQKELKALRDVSMLSLVQAEKLGQVTRQNIQAKFGNKGIHPNSNGWKVINQELTKLTKGIS
jgi:hypothetical protein